MALLKMALLKEDMELKDFLNKKIFNSNHIHTVNFTCLRNIALKIKFTVEYLSINMENDQSYIQSLFTRSYS